MKTCEKKRKKRKENKDNKKRLKNGDGKESVKGMRSRLQLPKT